MDGKTRATLKKYAKKTTAVAMAGMTAMSYGTPALAEETPTEKTGSEYEYAQTHDALQAATLEEAKEARDTTDAIRQRKEKAFADATDVLTDAQAAQELAMDTYTEQVAKANKASDDAGVAIAKALDEAIRESNETASHAEYAQLAYDKALADKNDADAKLTAAKNAAEKARQDYDAANEARGDATATSSELEAAKAANDKAQRDAMNAKKAVDNAAAELSTAKSATIDAADKVTSAESNLTSATTRLANAQSSYDVAKAAYDTSTEEGLAQAEAEFTAARSELTAASAEETSAKNRLKTAEAEYEAAKATLDDWQAKYDDAVFLYNSYDLSIYDKRIEEEQAKVDALQEEQNKAVDRLSELAITLGKTDDTINAANQAVNNARSAVDSAKKALDAASAELDIALAQNAESQQKVLSLYDFMQSKGYTIDESTLSAEYNGELTDMSSTTHAGEKGDATDFRNVLKALASLRELNSIRTINNQRELLVSDASMIHSAAYANWIAAPPDDDGSVPYNDNVALGTNAPLGEWYYAEKSIYDAAVESGYYNGNPMPNNWQMNGISRLKQTMPDFYAAVRNYLNVVNQDWAHAGAGMNSTDASMPVFFHTYEHSSSADQYSVSDWQTRFMDWVRAMSKADDDASKANIAYLDAFTLWESAQDELFNMNLDLIRVTEDSQEGEREYLELNERVASLSGDIKKAKQRVENEYNFKAQIEDELAKVQRDIDEAEAQIPIAQVQLNAVTPVKEAAEKAASDASGKVNKAQAAYETALTKYTNEQSENGRLNGLCVAAKENLQNARNNHSAMNTALENAKTEHETAQSTEQSKQTAHDEAVAAHSAAAALAESTANRLALAQKANDNATTNIDEVNRLFGLLQDANDKVTTASQELSHQAEVLNRALTSLQVVNAAKAQLEAEEANIRELSLSPVRVPLGIVGYEDMDDAIQKQLTEETKLSGALNALSVAESKVKDAQRLYDDAYEQWRDAVAEAALAQTRYDELLAMAPDEPGGDEGKDGPGSVIPVVPDNPNPVQPDSPMQTEPAEQQPSEQQPNEQQPGNPSAQLPTEGTNNAGDNAGGNGGGNGTNASNENVGGSSVSVANPAQRPTQTAPAATSTTIRVPLSYIIDSMQAGNTAGYGVGAATAGDSGGGVNAGNVVDEAIANDYGAVPDVAESAEEERDIVDDLNPLGRSNAAATDTDNAKAVTTAALAGVAALGAATAVFVGRSSRRTKRS